MIIYAHAHTHTYWAFQFASQATKRSWKKVIFPYDLQQTKFSKGRWRESYPEIVAIVTDDT